MCAVLLQLQNSPSWSETEQSLTWVYCLYHHLLLLLLLLPLSLKMMMLTMMLLLIQWRRLLLLHRQRHLHQTHASVHKNETKHIACQHSLPTRHTTCKSNR